MEKEVNYFYSNFKKIRKDKNISINDISNQTKIQEKYIIAIEEGNLNILPSVYTRLFLKSYSDQASKAIYNKIVKPNVDFHYCSSNAQAAEIVSKDDFELTIAFDKNKGIKKFLYTMSGIVKL